MKSNLLSVALFSSAAFVLTACAGGGSGTPSPNAPVVAPGTIETAGERGSFQGPIKNAAGEIEAILTIDVIDTDVQFTVSPSGAKGVLPLNVGGQHFSQGVSPTVMIEGSWNGSAWVGQITDGTNTNTFTLSAGASTLAAVSVGAPSGTFDGVLTYKGSGGKRPISLVLNPSTSFADAISSTLTSKVALKGSLIDNRGVKEALTNVVWDRETSTLSADGSVITSLGTSALRCKMSEVNAGDKDVLQCALSNSKGNSPVATGALSQKRVVVAPPYPTNPKPVPSATPIPSPQPIPTPVPTPAPTPAPVPTAVPVPPAPTPIVMEKNERVYSGAGVFTNEKGDKQNRSLTLTVTLKSDPTGTDQDAVIKFIIDGSRVGAKFTDAVFNSSTGDLRASQMLTLGPIAGALKLKCAGVSFVASQYDYYCHYESSVTNVTGEFHLQGTSK